MLWDEVLKLAALSFTAVGAVVAAAQYLKTQRWQRLKYAAEVVEKIYSDDDLKLAMRFLDWHDRVIFLPEKYKFYWAAKDNPTFAHKMQNMLAAMNPDNRHWDEKTKIFDLVPEFRKPEYMLYVEIFDRFFDYLSQLQIFMHHGLITEEDIVPIVYILRRMDNLDVFDGYIREYELDDVKNLIAQFRKPVKWVQKPIK